jgi:hypothetical protein
LSEIERLLRLKAAKYHESPSLMTPCPRSGSPTPGVSTLITSAPISASIIVQNGPARMRVRSTTRIPDSGTVIFSLQRKDSIVSDRRDQRRASFETAASRLPQDEVFSLCHIGNNPMLRSGPATAGPRLEARRLSMQHDPI